MVGCKDGFDLNDTQLCKDKTVMINDGHDLPWQSIWSVKKGYLEIDMPKHLYGLLSRYYSIYYGRQKYKDIDIVNPEGEKIVSSAKLRICCILDLEYEKAVLEEYMELGFGYRQRPLRSIFRDRKPRNGRSGDMDSFLL